MVKVKINAAVLETYAVQAFREAAFLLGRSFTEVISEPGAFDGFPGDIVDSGALRSSQQLEFVRRGEALFYWSVAYALYVHEGYEMRNGTKVEGRPWTQKGLERVDFQTTFEMLLRSKL